MIINIFIKKMLQSALYDYIADKEMELLDFKEHFEKMDKDNKKLWRCYDFLLYNKQIKSNNKLNTKFPYTVNEIVMCCMWKKKGLLNIC